MKPNGVTTTQAEPTEIVVEPVAGVDTNEDQPQEDQSLPLLQLENPENVQGANLRTATSENKANRHKSEPKNKTKSPGKTRPGTTVTNMTNKSNTASRAPTAHNRAANGGVKTAVNSAAKKPVNMMVETRKTALLGAGAQSRKGSTVTSVVPRPPVKAAEPVTATRPAVPTINSRVRPTAPSTSNKKPSTAGSSAAVKIKPTAPRPATAPSAKPSFSSASKVASISKTTRPTTAPASRSTTSSVPVRATIPITKPTALRTTGSASSAVHFKVSTTAVDTKKDIKTTNSAASRKPFASSTAVKPSKPEPPKPGATAKRLHANSKTSQPKTDDAKQVPTRKVTPSPRETPTRAVSGRMVAGSNNQQQGGNCSPDVTKLQRAKPTQSVSPLVIEKPTEELASGPLEPSESLVTNPSVTTAESMAHAEFVSEAQAAEPDQPQDPEVQEDDTVQVPASELSNTEIALCVDQVDAEQLATPSVAETSLLVTFVPPTVCGGEKSQKVDEYISVGQEVFYETVTLPPSVLPNADKPFSKGLEVAVKPEQVIHNVEDEEEEEKEGSQQVSVSDMSGTQPTEESRPGSAGVAGSVWRAGGLLSELDSEDVSCSQHGASELSAPGVLEGTESMDDLGEASLKGADGEGASSGSPDFEKVPDIPGNDDEDDEDDRVYDMEVGSEIAEDSHRQYHYSEDEDVEMASEGITESGLESYGNPDEDDFAEDYRLDNLNRMQQSSMGLAAASWSQENHYSNPWVESLQSYSTLLASPSSNQQADSEIATQASAQDWLNVAKTKGGPSSPDCPSYLKPSQSSPHPTPISAVDLNASLKPGSIPHPKAMSPTSTMSSFEQVNHSCSNTSISEKQKDYNISPDVGKLLQPLPVSSAPVAPVLPDITQNLVNSLTEEERHTPFADKLDGEPTLQTSVNFSPSLAVKDEDKDMEIQISRSYAGHSFNVNECYNNTQVQSLANLEECEEACVELEEVGSDTPQSAASAASYGFECTTTSNSNAQSTTESCNKSPGILSLENEEPFTDDSKDQLLCKEPTLIPTCAPVDADILDHGKQGKNHVNTEQQYMLCGEGSKDLEEYCSLGELLSTETDLDSNSSSQQQDWNPGAPHSYDSIIREKTDSFSAGRVKSTKQQFGPHVDYVTPLPCPSTSLTHRTQSMEPNVQLRRLEKHQQQLRAIEQRREHQSRTAISREEEKLVQKELEKQKKDLLALEIQQQQEELNQRQQIIQWQHELEQQCKHQNRPNKTLNTPLLSPSGLGTIYEALEPSDSDEDYENEWKGGKNAIKEKANHKISNEVCLSTKSNVRSPEYDAATTYLKSRMPIPEPIQEQMVLTYSGAPDNPPLSPSNSPQQRTHLELDWGNKADIVQQLISQTLLLAGGNCSQLLFLPGGAAGTLSPLETSLWPNLPTLTPPSATVTSVSSFSTEISGTSPQGEWTVVELETHH